MRMMREAMKEAMSEAAAAEEAEEDEEDEEDERRRVSNKKLEPHTEMWGMRLKGRKVGKGRCHLPRSALVWQELV